ncbi:DUF7144 family membrane protein [Streptomyces sp.]|uniref:DUF7144 family membrane protein n=1 Tax=Streptomyces sp. TaxID=1931 RepID=UPI002F3F6836
MSQQEPPAPPPPPGSKPPGSTGPTSSAPGAGHSPPGGRHPYPGTEPRHGWAAGGTVFAGLLLTIAGTMAILEGIVGISSDVVYVATRGDYTYKFNVTAWGWLHFWLGVIAVLVGFGLLGGAEWARYGGMLIAGLSMIANFIFLPYQPVWSVIMIAIDVFIIWALATYHPAKSRPREVL